MFYVDFEDHITMRFGIVIENWPLTCFAVPSAFKSRLKLSMLLNAWETDTTRFRKLSRVE